MPEGSTPSRATRDAPEWSQYWSTHHAHVGPALDSPLRRIEFEANFGPWLKTPSARVLEIGFGNGESLRYLAALGFKDLHGWDISADCVARARAENLPGELRHVDAVEALQTGPTGEFDVVLAKDLLEHLPRESVVPFTSGIWRALRPGGVFLARLPNMANPLAGFLRYDDFTHTLGFTENSLRQVFALGGFPREQVQIVADRLPGWPLLRHGLVGTFLREKFLGPFVRWVMEQALRTQRKGPAKVGTLRLIVAACKPA